jgi:hypothetical protein
MEPWNDTWFLAATGLTSASVTSIVAMVTHTLLRFMMDFIGVTLAG